MLYLFFLSSMILFLDFTQVNKFVHKNSTVLNWLEKISVNIDSLPFPMWLFTDNFYTVAVLWLTVENSEDMCLSQRETTIWLSLLQRIQEGIYSFSLVCLVTHCKHNLGRPIGKMYQHIMTFSVILHHGPCFCLCCSMWYCFISNSL